MDLQIRKKANSYYRQYLKGGVTVEKITAAMESQGYTVISFNNECSSEDVEELGRLMGVTENMRRCKGFTYADSRNRLVFINEDLSDRERIIVLLHEQGHILFSHMGATPVLGKDVMQEYEANEFVHYVITPDLSGKISRSRKGITAAAAVLTSALIMTAAAVSYTDRQQYHEDYVVTASGEKYHLPHCTYVKHKDNVRGLTEEEFTSGKYTPCSVCIPE